LKSLNQEDAFVYGFDPFYSQEEIKDLGFLFTKGFENLDGIFIHTAHPEYSDYNYRGLSKLKFIFDGRHTIDQVSQIKPEVVLMNF
jgi:UDP-N-acetyl-D-mannosaminuronate dehydrogenase